MKKLSKKEIERELIAVACELCNLAVTMRQKQRGWSVKERDEIYRANLSRAVKQFPQAPGYLQMLKLAQAVCYHVNENLPGQAPSVIELPFQKIGVV